ncbi:MAG TPA: PadR family transcriptional regulator [Micromonosporaceae bacterium]
MTEAPMREPAFLVLTALVDEPRHGYAVIQEVQRISDGQVRLQAGTLYGVLERLRNEGLIEVDREEVVQSRLRRYYRITALGATRLARETERLRKRADLAASRLRKLALGGGAA